MTVPAIQYFQVVAAAIPTLLIAVAIGAKQGEMMESVLPNGKRGLAIAGAISMFVLIFTIGIGEVAALTALVSGTGDSFQAILSYISLLMCLGLVAISLIGPLMPRVPFVVRASMIGAMILVSAFGLMAFLSALE